MIRSFVCALAVAGLTTPAFAEAHRYELDPDHTTVAFLVDHLGYADTLGIFRQVEGSFTYDISTQALSNVTVQVNSASVETFHKARNGHVLGKDFLNAKVHPVMIFSADSGTPSNEKTGSVKGNLTLLGQTHPLTLAVTLNKAAKYPFGHGRFVLGLTIKGTVIRSQYGMSYAVENGFVGDAVELIVETEAMRIE
ncbi:MAG: YceI family protein [Stappiaceae bacterium]